MNYRCGCTIGRSPGQAPKVCNNPLHGVPTNRRQAPRPAARTAADQKFEDWKRAAMEEMGGDIRQRAAARATQPAPRPAPVAPAARQRPAAVEPAWKPVTADERAARDSKALQIGFEICERMRESGALR